MAVKNTACTPSAGISGTRGKGKIHLVWGLLWLLCPVSLGLVAYAKGHPDWVERAYSLSFFPKWSALLSSVSGRLPFSLAEVLLILFGVGVLYALIRYIIRLKKSPEERLRISGRFWMWVGALGSALLFLFVIGGGLNYYRYSFTEYSGLILRPQTAARLRDMTLELAGTANILRTRVAEDENGVFILLKGAAGAAEEARLAYQRLTEENPQWEELLRRGGEVTPKRVFFSEAMSYMQIVGFYFPFTMEANVNVHTSPIDIPSAMCHELAHICGFMREDEANYIAWRACMASENDDFRYSGAVTALIYCLNALSGSSPEFHDQVMETVSESVRRDLEADSAYYRKYQTSFGTFSSAVNDVYLRMNDQAEGVQSYGGLVDLMLAQYERDGSLPAA